MLCYIVLCFVIIFIIYQIADHLVRIARIGNYRDRYILVTGCDTGFGNGIAKRLDRLGCNVFAGCLTEKGETELRKACSNRLHAISLDVTKQESVRKALEYVKSNLPKGRGLWGILNNAGVLSNYTEPDWLTIEDYKKDSEVNLWGLIDVTLTFLPLIKKEKGRLVNTASLSGRLCFFRCLPYSISKYGVEAFSDGMRQSLFYFGCKVSIIEPGGHSTDIFNGKRLSDTMVKAWERTTPDIREEYGEKFLQKEKVSFEKRKIQGDITGVVDAYEHALLARYPRHRYVVGRDAKFLLKILRTQALPEWFGDWIMRNLIARNHRYIAAVKKQ